MKIDLTVNLFNLQKAPEKNVFDLDVKLSKQATDDKIKNHLGGTITSISRNPCPTVGCATLNSFCC